MEYKNKIIDSLENIENYFESRSSVIPAKAGIQE